jgi:ribose 1,5-bisphosphokinase
VKKQVINSLEALEASRDSQDVPMSTHQPGDAKFTKVTKARLVYLIGPSGSGKDSIMAYARKHGAFLPVVYATRYITRPAEAGGETHFALSYEEFRLRQEVGFFALSWKSHGLMYGVGCEIDSWLEQGVHVVVNGSREYLPTAESLYPGLIPVLVRVDAGVLADRLLKRGRENRTEIRDRIRRAKSFPCDASRLVVIDNSDDIEQAGESFLSLLNTLTLS